MLLYLGCYLSFSLAYWALGHTDPEGHHYIYPPLNYHHPLDAALLVVFVTLVAVPLLTGLLWLWVRGCERIARARVARLRAQASSEQLLLGRGNSQEEEEEEVLKSIA